MTLETNPLKIGVVLFTGFELLDLYGPLEMFALLGEQVSLTMLAETPGAIVSSAGPQGMAEKSLSEPSAYDLLLIPGGIGTRTLVGNTQFLNLLRARVTESRFVASVCTGSALLAKADILDGHRATSNKRAFDWVMAQGPQVTWIRKARWVEDGRFWTSSGISAGIDLTLGLISHLLGRETSLEVARRAEYLWNEDCTADPFC